jgi:hypothetical protein
VTGSLYSGSVRENTWVCLGGLMGIYRMSNMLILKIVSTNS